MNKRTLLWMIILIIILSTIASASPLEATPGQSITIPFSFQNVTEIQGAFSIIGEEMLESVTYDLSGIGLSGQVSGGFCKLSGASPVSGTIQVVMEIKTDGIDQADILSLGFTYRTTDENGNVSDATSQAYAIHVVPEGYEASTPEEPVVTVNPEEEDETAETEEETEDDPEEPAESEESEDTEEPEESEDTEELEASEEPEEPEDDTAEILEPEEEPEEEPETPEITEAESAPVPVMTTTFELPSNFTAILLWSLGGLVAILAGVFITRACLARKKKKMSDHIPMIDYDIDDDYED